MYSAVHRKYQPVISKYVTDFGYNDMMIIDSQTGDVVYDFEKSPIVGTNLLSGEYSDSNAAELFRSLQHTKDRDVVAISDFAPFIPAFGRPVALVGTPVFDNGVQIGVLMLQFPVEATNRVMTGAFHWQQDGLGKTGETYLVGPDSLMRSRSRLLHEDPAAFYADLKEADYSAADIDRVKRAATATLSQRALTASTQQALAGHQGTQIDTNYLGKSVLTSYSPLDIPGLHWAIIADIQTSEVFAPLNALSREILISTVVIILLVSLIAVYLGRLFVRPLYRLIDRVRDINEGRVVSDLPIGASDEFGDLAVAFKVMYERLSATSSQLDQARQEKDAFLARMLPRSIAAVYMKGQHQSGERFDETSVLSAQMIGLTELMLAGTPASGLSLLNDLITSIDDSAERHGVEKLRTVGGSYLAVAGLPVPRLDHASRIVDFARDVQRLVRRTRTDRGVSLTVHIGIASGSVIAGIVGETKLTYDVWGETVDLARALADSATADGILVSPSCHELLHDLYRFGPPAPPVGKATRAWPLEANTDEDERTADGIGSAPVRVAEEMDRG